MKNLSPNHKLIPAIIIDMKSFVKKEIIDGNNKFSLEIEEIEKFFDFYKTKNYMICAIFQDSSVANGERLPIQVELDVNSIINLFEKNPFGIIKSCLHDRNGNTEPYCHKSMLEFGNGGILAAIEITAWENMKIVDWKNSIVVGVDSDMELMANCANLDFKPIDEFCTMVSVKMEHDANINCESFEKLLERYVFKFSKFDLTGLNKEQFKTHCHSMLESDGIAMRIRNELGLWLNDKQRILELFKEGGIEYGHPDDMSAKFLEKIYDKLKSIPDGSNDNTNV